MRTNQCHWRVWYRESIHCFFPWRICSKCDCAQCKYHCLLINIQQNDPGVLINIYQNLASYSIPGPVRAVMYYCNLFELTNNVQRPYTCGADSGPTTTTRAGVTTTLVTKTTTPAVVTTTSSKPTTTASTGGAPLYGQCGGIGWTGPTTCASGKCTASGQYYSQCLP